MKRAGRIISTAQRQACSKPAVAFPLRAYSSLPSSAQPTPSTSAYQPPPPRSRIFFPATETVTAHLSSLLAPLGCDLDEATAERVCTHKSASLRSTVGHNEKFAFLGRRILRLHLTLYLSSVLAKQPDHLAHFVSEESINLLLETRELGAAPGATLGLQKAMRWHEVMGLDGKPTGLFKSRGATLEAIVGAVYLKHGIAASAKVFESCVLPHLRFSSTLKNASRSIISSSRPFLPSTARWVGLGQRTRPVSHSTRPNSSLPTTSNEPIFFDKLAIRAPDNTVYDRIPAFRVLDREGKLLEGVQGEWKAALDGISEAVLVKMYSTMLLLPALDTILASSQRQGRISFYMTSYGEEGAVVGSAAAWQDTDEVFAQYREVGVLLWRGYPLFNLMAQVFGNASDAATRGRQMPCHYGWEHFHTISSPLATQIPQAAGAAYALKRTPGREQSCVICYMGEGATSEGDFHAGLNMASVLGGACVFFVRNNGFAISTPSSQQYRGDGIASRGPGYGIDTVRVDGNDPLAVYLACAEARKRAVEQQRPILVEAMTYRVGHHSTSDDSSAYRSLDATKLDSPIHRLSSYLTSLSPTPLWSPALEASTKAAHKSAIMTAFAAAEAEKKPTLDEMWGGVYDDLERPQREQREELKRLVGKWGETAAWKRELERFEGGKEAFLEGRE